MSASQQASPVQKDILANLQRFSGNLRHPDVSRNVLALARKHRNNEASLLQVLKWVRQNMSADEKEQVFRIISGPDIFRNRILRIKLGLPVSQWP